MRNVLVVDSNAVALGVVSEYLAARSFHVDCACSVLEAEDFIRQAALSYDAVMTDLRFSDYNDERGLDVVAAVKRVSPRTKVCLLASWFSSEVEDAARNAGADFMLEKPQPLQTIAEILSR